MSNHDSGATNPGADSYSRATKRVQCLTAQLLHDRTRPTIIADAMITQALAIWAADTGRKTAASELLHVWAQVIRG